MYLLPTIVCTIIVLIISFKIDKNNYLKISAMFCICGILLSSIVYGISIFSKTHATEVWSGKIISVKHQEEYDEVITETHTDSKGNTYTTTRIEHNNAKNIVNTSDGGNISVNKSLDGKTRFNDSFPNTNEELIKFYPIGTSTASIHSYKNKVQCSYSIYKHKNIDLKKYKDLPEYPIQMKNDIQIDRFIGDIKNKNKVVEKLNEVNSDLNSKQKNKQVNLIFVNLGDKSEDYGFALQDYWQGGNKNDFVICFGSNGDKVTWVYPFSWADSNNSEKLKIDTRNYMLKVNLSDDFTKTIGDISKMIETNFERKQFADFNYLTVELSMREYVFIVIINIILGTIILKCIEDINRY